MSKKMRTAFPTPVFNTPDLGSVFTHPLPIDEQRLLRCVETVLFKGTNVEVTKKISDNVYQIKTTEYPGDELYVDGRFLEDNPENQERIAQRPPKARILATLNEGVGTPYVWGGNCSSGIQQLAEFYPIPSISDWKTRILWTLKGVDCSGFLYEATDGTVPRNTSELISFGEPVLIEGKEVDEIIPLLHPLDLIVWRGHVIIINGETVIESRCPQGVVRVDLKSRLIEIMQDRKPVNDAKEHPNQKEIFVIRRWIDLA